MRAQFCKIAASLLLGIATCGFAQIQQNVGIQSDQSYSSTQIDAVNVLMGSVTHSIPIASYPQKGNLPPLSFSFNANSNPWYRQSTCDSYSEECITFYTSAAPPVTSIASSLGIPLSDSYSTMTPVINSQLLYDSGDVCNSDDPYTVMQCVASFTGYMGGIAMWYNRTISVYDDTGAGHALSFDASNPNWARATDGSGYAMYAPDNYNAWSNMFGTPISGTLYDANGNYSTLSIVGNSATPTSGITDLYGNTLTSHTTSLSGPPYWETVLTDSVGRNFSNTTSGDMSRCPSIGTSLQPLWYATKWSVPSISGTTSDYTFCMTGFPLHPGFFDSAGAPSYHCDDYVYNFWNEDYGPDTQFTVTTGSEPYSSVIPCDQESYSVAVQAIVLPNGSYWGFLYDAGSQSPCDNIDGVCTSESYGTIQKVILPTGATIDYQYNNIESGSDANYLNYRVLTQKTVTDLSSVARPTYYSYSTPVYFTYGSSYTTKETDALGNDTMHIFGAAKYSTSDTIPDPYRYQSSFVETETDHYQGSSSGGSSALLTKDLVSYVGQFTGGITDTTVRKESTTHYEGTVPTASTFMSYPSYSVKTYYSCHAAGVANCTSYYPYTILRDQPISTTVFSGDGTTLASTTSTPLDISNPAYAAENVISKNAKTKVFDGSSSLVAETDYGYDEWGFTGVLPGANTSVSKVLSGGSPVRSTVYYNSDGSVADTFSPNGTDTHVNTYQCSNLYPLSVTIAYGSTTTMPETTSTAKDCNTGKVTSSTDANGVVTSYAYDDLLLRPTSVNVAVGTSLQASTNYSYPSMHEVDMTRDKVTLGDHVLASSSLMDGIGHVTHTTSPGGVQQDFHYNLAGLLDWQNSPYLTTSDGVTYYSYNALGRPLSVTKPGGSATTTAYNGATTDSWDENGTHMQHTGDALGRLVKVMELGTSTDPRSLETDYTYDALNNLTYVNQHGASGETPRTRSFTYDSLSHLITSTNPETGAICYGVWSGGCTGGYDTDGNLLKKTDANGVTMTYTYDALDRMTSKSASDGSVNDGYTYDQTGTGPNEIGRLSYVHNGSVAGNGLYYDALGHISHASFLVPGLSGWHNPGIQATYDLVGNIISITYPDGRTVNQVYDSANHLLSTTDAGTGTAYFSSASYLPAGVLASASYGNGVNENILYNTRLQPCHTWANSPAVAPLTGYGNVYDRISSYANSPSSGSPCNAEPGNNGNIAYIADNVNTGQTQSFTYDGLNRLYTASRSDGAYNDTYNYDSFGNLIPSTAYTVSAATNQLNRWYGPVNEYSYDAAGNLTNSGTSDIGGHAFTYNSQSQIIAVDSGTTGSYVYNGLDERAYKSVASGSTSYVYLNGQPMAEYTSDGTWTDYIFAADQRIAKITNAGDLKYYLSDHLGTTQVELDASGNVYWMGQFTPFGVELPDGSTTMHYKFTGKQRDAETGLDDFEARMYSSAIGRFLSPDDFGGHLEDPETLNRYSYVGNNPLSRTDPDGHDFYLACTQTKDNASTCQSQQVSTDEKGKAVYATVQGATKDGSFTATRIGNDAKGNLVDLTTGTGGYTGTFDGKNVSLKNSSGGATNGVWLQDGKTVAGIQGVGALDQFNFTFHNHNEVQTFAADYTFNGTQDQAAQALEKAGFVHWNIGFHDGRKEYRLPSDVRESTHFALGNTTTDPKTNVPTNHGDMHTGEYYPGKHILDHFWHDVTKQ